MIYRNKELWQIGHQLVTSKFVLLVHDCNGVFPLFQGSKMKDPPPLIQIAISYILTLRFMVRFIF